MIALLAFQGASFLFNSTLKAQRDPQSTQDFLAFLAVIAAKGHAPDRTIGSGAGKETVTCHKNDLIVVTGGAHQIKVSADDDKPCLVAQKDGANSYVLEGPVYLECGGGVCDAEFDFDLGKDAIPFVQFDGTGSGSLSLDCFGKATKTYERYLYSPNSRSIFFYGYCPNGLNPSSGPASLLNFEDVSDPDNAWSMKLVKGDRPSRYIITIIVVVIVVIAIIIVAGILSCIFLCPCCACCWAACCCYCCQPRYAVNGNNSKNDSAENV